MKQAVILAAGEGKRLRPFTANRPKAMLSVAGKPVLQYTIEALAENGIRSIILVVGYRKEQIFDYFGSGEDYNVEISYIEQEKQVGTANALLKVESMVEDRFLVLPGDKLIETRTISQFVAVEPPAMLVKSKENPVRSSVVIISDGAVEEAMRPERRAVSSESHEQGIFMINTGIYAFTREIFDYIPCQTILPAVLNDMINQGKRINAVETEGTWQDITYPWDIIELNASILRHVEDSKGGTIEDNVSIKGNVSLGDNTVIRAHCCLVGPVVFGRGCEIGPSVCLLPSTSIGDNVCISPFTEIRNSVISSDVSIGSGSIIQDSVIDRGCLIKGHFAAISDDAEIKLDGEYHSVNNIGAMLGEGCRLDDHVIAKPGVIVGKDSQIRAMRTISGRLPDQSVVL
jgi:glucose-1-phosphate thymidylyltransferase